MNYNDLTIVEKTKFIGELVHLVTTDEVSFYCANSIIKVGKQRGLFDRVTICPEEIEGQPYPPFSEP